MDIVVGDTRTAGQAKSSFEERFGDTVHVGGAVREDRLFMHRFPERTCLYIVLVQPYTHRLHIRIRFAVGMEQLDGMHRVARSADTCAQCLPVGFVFSGDVQLRRKRNGNQPEIAVVTFRWIVVDGNAFNIAQQALIQRFKLFMMPR